jgi:hypothetical protein
VGHGGRGLQVCGHLFHVLYWLQTITRASRFPVLTRARHAPDPTDYRSSTIRVMNVDVARIILPPLDVPLFRCAIDQFASLEVREYSTWDLVELCGTNRSATVTTQMRDASLSVMSQCRTFGYARERQHIQYQRSRTDLTVTRLGDE